MKAIISFALSPPATSPHERNPISFNTRQVRKLSFKGDNSYRIIPGLTLIISIEQYKKSSLAHAMNDVPVSLNEF